VGLTLRDFARASDDVAATAAKLAKQRRLAELLAGCDADDDVLLAVRYSDGRAFSRTEERVLGVSGALLLDAVMPLLGIDYATLRPVAIRHGELGNAIGELWQPLPVEPALQLVDVQRSFDALAATTSPDEKRSLLTALWTRVGEPREAAYLAKVILGDLRTGVKEGTLIPAIAQAFARDESGVRRALLLTGDVERVAVMARHDRLGDARFELFHPIQFMLAQSVDQAESDAPQQATTLSELAYPLIAEPKLDGIRAQVHMQDVRVAIYTRTLDRTEQNFPDVVEQLRGLNGSMLLDGEIVAVDPKDESRRTAFAHVQKRLGRVRDLKRATEKFPCRFVAFDVLYADGELLIDKRWRERRAKLESLGVRTTDAIEVNSETDVWRTFGQHRAGGDEGVMLKDPAGPYLPGKRGQGWLKVKGHLPTLDCVVTYAERGHGKRRGVLSDYTFAVWDRDAEPPRLVNVGKAYSGLTDAEIAEMTKRFEQDAIETDGRVYRVKPSVVLEIAFDAITKSNRHDSGFALRFPRIKTIRHDRAADDADSLERVREVFALSLNSARDAVRDEPEEAPADGQLRLF
jgi:DNA ligase-1